MESDKTPIQESEDFRAGFDAMMRLHQEALRRGWQVPDRMLVIEIVRLEHAARLPRPSRTLPVLARPLFAPDWYRGRAEALREILRTQRTRESS
jgi:hypothetical protein